MSKIIIRPVPDQNPLFEAPELQTPSTALCQVRSFHGEAQHFHSERAEISTWKVARPIPGYKICSTRHLRNIREISPLV